MSTQILSSGGGVNSAAMAALVVRGDIEKPRLMIIADTGREPQSTWDYHNNVIAPALAGVGVESHIAPHTLAYQDLYAGPEDATIIMPMYSARGGILPKFCSDLWKTRVIHRYLRKLDMREGNMWIGFAVDEMERMRAANKDKWQHRYPLVEKRMSRADCYSLVEKMDWPTPPRSSCWMCPYRRDDEWRSLPANEFQKAVDLEAELQEKDPDVFFHRSKVPLAEANLGDAQSDLFEAPCTSGLCFT